MKLIANHYIKEKENIMKRTILLTALAGTILLTGCGTSTVSTDDISSTEVAASKETSATTTTTYSTTTTFSERDESDLTETKSPNDEESYIKDLLGDGVVLLDKQYESGLYSRVVLNDNMLNTYFKLPEDTIEYKCMYMMQTISSMIDVADSNGYSSITFHFAEQDSTQIAMYSINNYCGEWTQLVPILWSNDEYEEVWNKLMSGEYPSTESEPESVVIYDENDIKVTYNSHEIEDYTGNVNLKILIENNSESELIIIPQDFYTNGYKTTVGGVWKILPGKKANEEIMIYKSELEDNDIEKVEQVEFSFTITIGDKHIVTDRISLSI